MTIATGEPANPWNDPGPAPTSERREPPPSAIGHDLAIVFHGSGSEYFRIWAVNLLLTLVTFGLYYPWAKVRRLRYFYGNTFIGDHALDFHGDPKLMLRGFLLAALLAISYSVAGKLSPTAGLIAFVVVAVLWPALFWTSQRFRLANTSWRGLRFRFTGDLKGAYRSMLPFFVPSALLLAGSLMDDASHAPKLTRFEIAQLLLLPVAALLLPLVFWMLKRYQHGHFNLGQIQTELKTGVGSFYGLGVKAAGLLVIPPLFLGVSVALLYGRGLQWVFRNGGNGRRVSDIHPDDGRHRRRLRDALADREALHHLSAPDLVWGRTASPELRFASMLRYGPLVGLTFKNALLTLVTLGFYAPFARIASARMRLQAVSVQSTLDPDELFASLHDRVQPGAAGDAAGDLFGSTSVGERDIALALVPDRSADAAVDFFDGRTARPRRGTASIEGGTLSLQGDQLDLRLPLRDVRWPERTRHGARLAHLRGGGSFQALDAAAWDAWARRSGLVESPIVRAQQSWRRTGAAVLALLALVLASYRWGVPLLSSTLLKALPYTVDRQIGDAALKSFDASFLLPSRVPAARQDEIGVRSTTSSDGYPKRPRRALSVAVPHQPRHRGRGQGRRARPDAARCERVRAARRGDRRHRRPRHAAEGPRRCADGRAGP